MKYDKPTIVYVCDYCRIDYVLLLKDSFSAINLYFLYYNSSQEETNKDYQLYGKCIYWISYKDTFELLEKVRPFKVIFLYIDSYNHLALNLACKESGIPTYLLEHGLRADYATGFDPFISPPAYLSFSERLKKTLQKISGIKVRLLNRMFLINSIKKLSSDNAQYTWNYIKVRSKFNYLETTRRVSPSKRLAQHYIAFSPGILDVHRKFDTLPANLPVYFIGVPYFDHLAHTVSNYTERAILLIDQPLAEHGLLQWNMEHKRKFVEQICNISKAHHYKLYVKPHPKQNVSIWLAAEKLDQCKIVNDDELASLASKIPVIIGFYSTYLMPFAAFGHTTVITYENHPAGRLLISAPLVDAKVSHPIHEVSELNSLLPEIEKLHQEQKPHKVNFVDQWLYKFDGNSGKRLKQILLEDTESSDPTPLE